MFKMTEEQRVKHVRSLADSRCRAKHPEVYDGLIQARQSDPEKPAPPCSACLEAMEDELRLKKLKMHGIEVSPEESLRIRHELGLAGTDPDINPDSAR